MLGRVGLPTLALALAASPARAEHEHGPMETGEAGSSTYAARVALVAASYETMFYEGDYQGAQVAFLWSHGRFGLGANVPMYRLVGNGKTTFGLGDAMVHGQATLAGDRALSFGVVFGVGLPTGDMRPGLGMGHPMLMPAAFVAAELGDVRLSASGGYGQAIGGGHHGDHGSWPLVDPMSQSEITYTTSGDYVLATAFSVGARLLGAFAIDGGSTRVIAGARAGWTSGRFETAFELQAGLAGDPFKLRGLVQTAVHF